MDVIECDDSRRDAWDEYVRRTPGASFYHLYDWRRINEGEFGHRSFYLAALSDGQIAGVLPIVQLRSRFFGNLGCSMPFVNFGGPCVRSLDAEDALLREAARLVSRERLAYLEMRNRRPIGADLPTSDRKVSMTVDLDTDPELLWKRFTTDHRRDIRRAYKNGLTARVGGAELLPDFYTVLSESWHLLGTPFYRRRYFERILTTFPCCRICVVYKGDEPAAAALDGAHAEIVEGMWLGIKAAYRRDLAGYVLYWELIKNACERGFRRFHLGRSTADGTAEAFKRKWNAYPTRLYWQYILGTRRTLPALNVDNTRYKLAIRAWRRLPNAVIRRLGPPLARSIP